MTKTCPKCKADKDIEQFDWRNKAKVLRQVYCRGCRKGIRKTWYEKHKHAHKEKVKLNVVANRKVLQAYVLNYLLSHPCIGCGENDVVVLEFDHVRGKKKNTICALISTGCSLQTLIKEIEKCEVRCANCHRRKTAVQCGWTNRLIPQVGFLPRAPLSFDALGL